MNISKKITAGWSWAKEHRKISLMVLIVVLGGGYYLYHRQTAAAGPIRYVTTKARIGSVATTIEGSGQVAAVKAIEIKPQASGRVTSLDARNGDTVVAGTAIAHLDGAAAAISLRQAEASYASTKASYDKLLNGTYAPDLAVARASVDSAKVNLEQVRATQDLTVKNAYHNLLNAGITAVADTTNRSNVVPAVSGNYTGPEGVYTITIYNAENGLAFRTTGIDSAVGSANKTVPVPLGNYGLWIQFGTGITNGDTWTITIPNKTSSAYLSANNSYQSALLTQKQAVADAENNVAQTELALNQKVAPPRPEDVVSARASLDSSAASLESARNAYNNTVVTAPIAGVLSQINIQVGQNIDSGTVVTNVLAPQKMVSIPLNEVDATNVKIGQAATITFDAIDDLTITGQVYDVDTLGTVTSGVVNYNVRVVLDTTDPRIKPGMSATVSIAVASHDNVLTLPNSAVKSQGNRHYVEILDPAEITPVVAGTSTRGASRLVTSNESPRRQVVEIGLEGDTLTEIKSGISDTDLVVAQTLQGTGTKATANTPTIGNILSGSRGATGGAVRTGTGGGGGQNVRFGG